MSLILEALRRSEAERQLGRAPDVLAPMPMLRTPRRARRWPWWLALALLLATLALLASLWLHMQPTSHQAEQPAAAAVAAPGPSANIDIHAAAATRATNSQLAPVQFAPVATPISTAAPAAASHPQSSALTGPVTIFDVARKGQTPTPPASSTPAVEQVATALPAPASPAPAPDATTRAPAQADVLESIADLAPAERAALPALKVSMHVYADQPGDRFMIVDGQRVGEGARIGDRIVLVQIRRDGGVLDIGGRRLLLPKP